MQSSVNVAKIISHEDFYQSVYLQLAQENDIDLYSYQLEVMMDQDIHFSNATGCAEGCIESRELNLELLRDQYEKLLCSERLEVIALKCLSPSEMTASVKKALIEAYQLGRVSNQNPV